MKVLFLVTICLATFATKGFADDAKKNAEFEQNKTQRVNELDERIKKLTEHKACISAANDHEAMKKCNDGMQEWRKAERAQHIERRKANIDKRMQRLQEEKSKLGAPTK